MKYILAFFSVCLAFSVKAELTDYFEVRLNHQSIYNSGFASEKKLSLERDSLSEEDLIEFRMIHQTNVVLGDFELHIKVGTSTDLTFISDEARFVLNMGWLTQFANREVSVYLYDLKNGSAASSVAVHKIVDLLIS